MASTPVSTWTAGNNTIHVGRMSLQTTKATTKVTTPYSGRRLDCFGRGRTRMQRQGEYICINAKHGQRRYVLHGSLAKIFKASLKQLMVVRGNYSDVCFRRLRRARYDPFCCHRKMMMTPNTTTIEFRPCVKVRRRPNTRIVHYGLTTFGRQP
jgi:hypothetical protein